MVSGSRLTLHDAVEEYLLAREARYSEATVRNEGHVLRRFAATVTPRPIQLRHLTANHVETWFVSLRRDHRDRNNRVRPAISPGTWNFYYARLKAFTEWAARKGHLRHDLLAHVQPMRDFVRIRQQPSSEELGLMLSHTSDPRDRAILAVAMNTALRSAEIRRLKVGDLDLERLDLRVWISKSRTQDTMPVTSDLAEEMRRWLRAYSLAIERPVEPGDLLLPASRGPRIVYLAQSDGSKIRDHVHGGYDPLKSASKLERVVQTGLRAIGRETKGEGIHTIRRAVARLVYDRHRREGHESAVRVVMTLLHHTNASTTERYLGLTAEREARDLSLRGQSFLSTVLEGDVVALRRLEA